MSLNFHFRNYLFFSLPLFFSISNFGPISSYTRKYTSRSDENHKIKKNPAKIPVDDDLGVGEGFSPFLTVTTLILLNFVLWQGKKGVFQFAYLVVWHFGGSLKREKVAEGC